jgi:hypothetical protein
VDRTQARGSLRVQVPKLRVASRGRGHSIEQTGDEDTQALLLAIVVNQPVSLTGEGRPVPSAARYDMRTVSRVRWEAPESNGGSCGEFPRIASRRQRRSDQAKTRFSVRTRSSSR